MVGSRASTRESGGEERERENQNVLEEGFREEDGEGEKSGDLTTADATNEPKLQLAA